ncbi:3-oxoacyl-ACP synthase [Goodfellowiella coeruleoviolacea]|uniref:3-oxoacyl-[acyl-carrier-protein] synthase-3 n=1 Tax=Goodfellowiella coeruleoviolacea TaxID=334858 RepID=A0AAE3GHU4_9PSEU|nr:3-oxoacyl-ACP synthase [Goodfellowiella coeruleoviolacea]MCP2167664.1 3-oxoacyl-[acyl-carrier-protein] synthase-3 [Goodfellowiella coeruleoviolacea]
MSAIALRAASWYLPDDSLAVADLPELAGLRAVERETCLALGVDRVAVADDLSAVDLGVRAAQQALAQAGLRPDDVDVLILVQPRAPEALMASDATHTQALLGAHRALSFSVGDLGCASIAPALLTARGLLSADPDLRTVLVVHGSKPAPPHRYRHPVTVNGDSGQALVVSRQGPVRVLDILVETNGAYWDLFRVDYRDQPWQQWREKCTNVATYSFRLGGETRNRLRALYDRLLRRNGLRPDEITHHVSHNLSLGGFRFLEESLGVEIDEVCRTNLRRYGHLGPNDMLLNLYAALGPRPAGTTSRVVAFNASPAAAWSAMLVETGHKVLAG